MVQTWVRINYGVARQHTTLSSVRVVRVRVSGFGGRAARCFRCLFVIVACSGGGPAHFGGAALPYVRQRPNAGRFFGLTRSCYACSGSAASTLKRPKGSAMTAAWFAWLHHGALGQHANVTCDEKRCVRNVEQDASAIYDYSMEYSVLLRFCLMSIAKICFRDKP